MLLRARAPSLGRASRLRYQQTLDHVVCGSYELSVGSERQSGCVPTLLTYIHILEHPD